MGKKRMGQNKKCLACEKEFYVAAYRINTAKFCSLECQNHKQYERPKFKCLECKIYFEDSPSRFGIRKFCSVECYNIFQTDKKSCQKEKRRLSIKAAREKGHLGKSTISIRKYALSEKEKKCEFCAYDEYECCLDIHHLDSNPNNNTLENLAVLCVMCHRKVHRKIICINGIELKSKLRKFPKKSDKLTLENVQEIKNLLKEKNITHRKIAQIYGVGRECITKINRGIRWQ